MPADDVGWRRTSFFHHFTTVPSAVSSSWRARPAESTWTTGREAPSPPWAGDLSAAFLEAHTQLVAALVAEGQVMQAEALAGHLGWLPPAE
jgi:hypothetical protein